MKRILLFLYFLSCVYLQAQTLIFKDKLLQTPIEGVSINTAKAEYNANEWGQLTINISPDSVYTISHPNYFTSQLKGSTIIENHYVILLSEAIHKVGEARITVNRFGDKASRINQQTFSINKEQMEFSNQSNTADLLEQSGKVFVEKSQMGGGSIVMRGFEANKVLIVIDGIRMNNAIYRGGHLQNIITVDNNMLEKTELYFGPNSTNFGSDALGGVMYLHSKKPKLSSNDKTAYSTNAMLRYGTAMNEKTAHFDFNIGLKKWAFLTSATYSNFGDMTIGKRGTKGYESWGRRPFYVTRVGNKDSIFKNIDSFKQIPTGYTQIDLMQKILFKPSSYVQHLINVQLSNSSNVPRFDRLIKLDANGKPISAEWYYGPQYRFLSSYNLNLTNRNAAYDMVNIIAAYQHVKESRHDRKLNSLNKNNRYEDVKIATLNADFEKKLSKATELRYGAEFTYNDVTSTADKTNINTGVKNPLDTRYPDGGSIMRTLAFYTNQSTYLHKTELNQWQFNSGIRFTNTYLHSIFINKTFFPFLGNSVSQRYQNTTGNMGLIYKHSDKLKLWLSLASGFRAPNVDDVAKVFESSDKNQTVVVPSPNLQPEYSTNIELGSTYTFSKSYTIEANVYYTSLNNALTLGPSELNGKDTITFNGTLCNILSMQNALRAYVYGGYIGMHFDLNENWNINASASYTYGRIATDTTPYPLDHIPPVFGNAGLTYKNKNLKVEFYTLFNGAKKSSSYNLIGEDNKQNSADPINGFSPAWQTFNLRGLYNVNSWFKIQLAVENILDQHVRTFSSGYSSAGRNIKATLRLTL